MTPNDGRKVTSVTKNKDKQGKSRGVHVMKERGI